MMICCLTHTRHSWTDIHMCSFVKLVWIYQQRIMPTCQLLLRQQRISTLTWCSTMPGIFVQVCLQTHNWSHFGATCSVMQDVPYRLHITFYNVWSPARLKVSLRLHLLRRVTCLDQRPGCTAHQSRFWPTLRFLLRHKIVMQVFTLSSFTHLRLTPTSTNTKDLNWAHCRVHRKWPPHQWTLPITSSLQQGESRCGIRALIVVQCDLWLRLLTFSCYQSWLYALPFLTVTIRS